MPPAGYFVDTNLLLLYIIGQEDPQIIAKHRRLEDYSAQDYTTLMDLLARAGQLFVTPNTLTEASNLLGQHGEPERSRLFRRFQNIIRLSNEITVASIQASSHRVFVKLGLADAVLWEVATAETPLITVDLSLYLELIAKGGVETAINFNPLRAL